MKDDLISREAAIEAANNGAYDWDGGFSPSRYDEITKAINAVPSVDAPTVDAVPLDKLCDRLAKHLGYPPCPCGYDLKGTSCNPDWTKKECWYYCLTNWMEEQDAVD